MPVDVSKIAGWVVNSVYPDQTPCSVVSDLGLHCYTLFATYPALFRRIGK